MSELIFYLAMLFILSVAFILQDKVESERENIHIEKPKATHRLIITY